MKQKGDFENIDNNKVQYSSIEDAIKVHAETYSFNIESALFPQLTEEQQKLWRKEIEQAYISGGDAGKEYIIAEIKRLLTEWCSYSSTEAKYRHEAYIELLEWIDK